MSSNPFSAITFVLGAHRLEQLPHDAGSEVAFAGRSNAGKSSAINAIVARHGLARTSRTPGRTQQLNVFSLGATRRLIDLPGYGYARAPERLRAHWADTLHKYLLTRRSLTGVVLMVDIRLELQPGDVAMLETCSERELAVAVLATKADKLSRSGRAAAVRALRTAVAAIDDRYSVDGFSATSGTGLESVRHWICARLAVPVGGQEKKKAPVH